MLEYLQAVGRRVVLAEELLARWRDETANPFMSVKTTIGPVGIKTGELALMEIVREYRYRI